MITVKRSVRLALGVFAAVPMSSTATTGTVNLLCPGCSFASWITRAEAGHSGSTLRDSYTLTGTKGTLLDQYSKGEPADETSERRDSEESDLVTPTSTTGKPRTGCVAVSPMILFCSFLV